MRARATTLLFIIVMTAATLLPACRDDKTAASAGAHKVEAVCRYCEAKATISTPLPADQEEWPKECPSCKRAGAYVAGTCGSCSKAAPLMDARTQSYGAPEFCPHCGKPWKPAPPLPAAPSGGN